MSEQAIANVRASVMIYDDSLKKWKPAGTTSTQGVSKVQIYHHLQMNTFRVVGRKTQDHEVVINCAITKGLNYNQTTTTFHQWRDKRQVYGLNFVSPDDAASFAEAMLKAIDVVGASCTVSTSTTPAAANAAITTANQSASSANACTTSANSQQFPAMTPSTPRDSYQQNGLLSSNSSTITIRECHNQTTATTAAEINNSININNNINMNNNNNNNNFHNHHLSTSSTSSSSSPSAASYYQNFSIDKNPGQNFSNEKPIDKPTCQNFAMEKSTPGHQFEYHQQQQVVVEYRQQQQQQQQPNDDVTELCYTVGNLMTVHNSYGHQRRSSQGSNSTTSSGGSAQILPSNVIYSSVNQNAQQTPPTGGSPLRPAPSTPPVPPPPPAPYFLRSSQQPLRVGPSQAASPATPQSSTAAASMVPAAPPLPTGAFALGLSVTPEKGPALGGSSLAQAIASAKLRKTSSKPGAEIKEARSASVGSVESNALRVTSSSQPNHSDVISEMTATLARRRMMLQESTANGGSGDHINSESPTRNLEKESKRVGDGKNGGSRFDDKINADSPRTHRKVPSGSSLSSQEEGGLSIAPHAGSTNMLANLSGSSTGLAHRSLSNGPLLGNHAHHLYTSRDVAGQTGLGGNGCSSFLTQESLEQMKQEILQEIRAEISKAKQEIIEVLKQEFSSR